MMKSFAIASLGAVALAKGGDHTKAIIGTNIGGW